MAPKERFQWRGAVLYQDSCVKPGCYFNKFTVTVVAQINLNLSQQQAATLQTEKQSPRSS